MTLHRPIVLRSGRLTELPVGDSLAGVGFDPDALPPATDLPPESFIVKQSGQWVLATYAQMQGWFATAVVQEHGYGLLTEAGEFLLTEAGDYLIQEAGAALTHGYGLLSEAGAFLLTEAGDYLIQEAGTVGAYVLTELGGALLTEAGGFITQEQP